MRNLTFTFLFSLFILGTVSSQDKVGDMIPLADVPESKALVAQASEYAQAVVDKNFSRVIELTHADIVKMGGGEEFMVGDLTSQSLNLENQGLIYKSAEVGNHPEFFNSGEEMQTVINVKYQLQMNGQKVESWVNLFAVSADKGVNWSFVNLEKFDDASLREFVGNVSEEFVFPK